jgi:hypothetical protein
MNFKSILVVGLSIATLGLSLPAHAGDTSTMINNSQSAVINGSNNHTNQSIKNSVRNNQTGNGAGNTGTSINNGQALDITGDGNKVNQTIYNRIKNSKKQGN